MPIVSMLNSFPNELFHEVFQYLTTYEILYAFKDLNNRINALLSKYDKYNLDFRSWSKSKYDFVCQSISAEQVRSLILSDANDTCRQIRRFFRSFYIRQFVNLRSLALFEISEEDLQKLVTKFQFCPKLSSLTIRLTQGFIPKITGLSLKHLSIGICTMDLLQELLLSSMPDLIDLDVQLIVHTIPIENDLLATEVLRFRIELLENSNVNYDHIAVLLQCMPKLEELTFIAVRGHRFIDGNRWEHLIRRYSPQLKRFHFKIQPNVVHPNSEQLLSTFRTHFWLNEKQWFIHCDHYDLRTRNHLSVGNIHLYTLPYCYKQFYLSSSTIPSKDVMKEEYYNIKNLYLSYSSDYNEQIKDHYYFPNVHSLTIQNLHQFMPMNNLIDLSQLKHFIEQNNPINADEFYSHILVHSNNLYSLELSWHTLVSITRNFTDQRVCYLLKKQIKCLNLLNLNTTNNKPNDIRTEKLIEIFGKNLEKLNFSVMSIDDILIVLNQMVKLYSVGIECNTFHKTMNSDELIVWLMKNVSRLKHFTHQIRSITSGRVCLSLWISS